MNQYPHHSRTTYMDDRVYRSAPTSPHEYEMLDSRTPRYSPSAYNSRYDRRDYFGSGLDDGYGRRARSPYDRGFYGYDTEALSANDELVRRTNREAAIANGAITRSSGNVQLHPMMTLNGRYPIAFSVPRRLEDVVYMDPRELDSVMRAYDLGATRRRYYRGSLVDRFNDGDPFHKSNSERLRDLIALFEFLGAYRLVEHLRRS